MNSQQRFAPHLLSSCPPAGKGVHSWLFRTASKLHRRVANKDQLFALLAAATESCGRYVPDREIQDAIVNSLPGKVSPGKFGSRWDRQNQYRRWPRRDYRRIAAVAKEGLGLQDFSAGSSWSDGGELPTEEIIDRLFPGNPLLCCGRSVSAFATRPREEWRGELSSRPHIVPSPMTALTGRTRSGKLSGRSDDNTGPRRFLVIDFDFIEKDDQGRDTDDAPMLRELAACGIGIPDLCAALHSHLAGVAPLVLVLHSGAKSLHGWFWAHQQPEDKLRKFMRYAVAIGADPMTFTASQMVRMPNAVRENGRLQRVHYFRPEVLQ